MNNLEAQADIYSKKYPHYRTYAQCQSKAFMMGMFAMIAGTSGGYIAQELMRNKLWYGRKSFFLTSIVFGSCAGYLTVSRQTKVCQDMWMALEEKHTSLQPISERTPAADSSDNT